VLCSELLKQSTIVVGRSNLLRRGNGHLHDRLFDGISFLSPSLHAIKHLLDPEAEGRQFRSGLGGGVAEDAVAVCYYDLVSGNEEVVEESMVRWGRFMLPGTWPLAYVSGVLASITTIPKILFVISW